MAARSTGGPMIADLLERKRTHVVLWAPHTGVQAPQLIIDELQGTNPVSLANECRLDMADATGTRDLWHLATAQAGLQAQCFQINHTA
jgi:hypothetical protein